MSSSPSLSSPLLPYHRRRTSAGDNPSFSFKNKIFFLAILLHLFGLLFSVFNFNNNSDFYAYHRCVVKMLFPMCYLAYNIWVSFLFLRDCLVQNPPGIGSLVIDGIMNGLFAYVQSSTSGITVLMVWCVTVFIVLLFEKVMGVFKSIVATCCFPEKKDINIDKQALELEDYLIV